MNGTLMELEARAKKLGYRAERNAVPGGGHWLAIYLPGVTTHTIGCHWDGRLHINLSVCATEPLALLSWCRAIVEAHDLLMRCGWCGESGIHPECAREEAQLESEKWEAKYRTTREYAEGAAMDRMEDIS
jgi:hypothetical protein